jgi:hypothetical protein
LLHAVRFDDLFGKAFGLAFFLHGEKSVAAEIASTSLLKLEVAAAAQNKRLYYNPSKGNGRADVSRTKITLRDEHLLQRLVYIESEPHEKRKEEELDEGSLLVHFIKHLVRITLKRNSFYVALGVNRLLHDYTTAQAMEIYNVVVQDPDRVKDDYYYRSRKGRLVEEIKERFGSLIELTRGTRGEEKIQAANTTVEHTDLVRECLEQFRPWETPCVIGRSFDPVSHELPALSSHSSLPDDTVEINRIHALLDPACYERLTRALRLELPASKLRVPKFSLRKGGNGMRGNGKHRQIPGLSEAELETIRNGLVDQSLKRKRSFAGVLSVVVDGVPRARIDVESTTRVSLDINENAELVEVYATGEQSDLLLATHLLSGDYDDKTGKLEKAAIRLEGGQEISFSVSRVPTEGSADLMSLEVAYRETAPLRASALSLLRLRAYVVGILSRPNAKWGLIAVPAFGALLVATLATVVWIAYRSAHNSAGAPYVAAVHPLESPSPGTGVEGLHTVAERAMGAEPSTENANEESKMMANDAPPKSPNSPHKTEGPGAHVPAIRSLTSSPNPQSVPRTIDQARIPKIPEGEATRGMQSSSTIRALSQVKKIYVEPIGNDSQLETLAAAVAKEFATEKFLEIVEEKENADAVLKIRAAGGSSIQSGTDLVSNRSSRSQSANRPVTVILVNEDGNVVWPSERARSQFTYTGTVRAVSSRIVRDLESAVQKAAQAR